MKCFYHSADLDGQCSGAIVKNVFPECEMIGINYGNEFPFDTIKEGEVVFMVDFSLQPFEQMEKLTQMCDLKWIDHHKSAIKEAIERDFTRGVGVLDTELAGCELTWNFLHKTSDIPLPVKLLGRYDVWDHDYDPAVLTFQYGMRNVNDTSPENQSFWSKLFNYHIDANEFITMAFHGILGNGYTILDYENSQNEKFCSAYAFETTFDGYKAICVNKGFTNSKVFDSVWDEKKYDIMITFVRRTTKEWKVSLYTTKDFIDCGAIAKNQGGGGHPGAAGFQCETLPFPV